MQQTSLKAYLQLNTLLTNHTYNCIISALTNFPEGLTDREIAEILGYKDLNVVRPRRKELVNKGIIEDSGIEKKAIIQNIAFPSSIVWKLVNNAPLFPMEIKGYK
jgi:hypothetical protein